MTPAQRQKITEAAKPHVLPKQFWIELELVFAAFEQNKNFFDDKPPAKQRDLFRKQGDALRAEIWAVIAKSRPNKANAKHHFLYGEILRLWRKYVDSELKYSRAQGLQPCGPLIRTLNACIDWPVSPYTLATIIDRYAE